MKQGARWPWRAIVIAVFLMAYFSLQVFSYTQRSATYDEPMHLAAGYAALAKGDYRVDATHPPLARMWAALPLLAMEEVAIDTTEIDRLDQNAWMAQGYAYTHDFLFAGQEADRLLDWARFMIVMLGALLGLGLFRWVEEWLGLPSAALALGFYLLSPNLAAHATLVTTDFAVSLMFFGTVWFLWRTCRRFSAGNIAGLAVCFAAALVTKFSAVLLLPVGLALLVAAVGRTPAMTWRRAAALVVLLAVAAWLMIWAVYGFRHAPSDTPGWLYETDTLPVVHEKLPVVGPLLKEMDARHLLPNAYAQGFLISYVASEMQPAYLGGEVRTGGWWYYFPVALLLKTPVPMLLLLAAGLVVLWTRRATLGAVNAAFVLLPPVIFLMSAMATNINIGLRHILPVYPFVLLIAAAAAGEILAAAWRRRTKLLVLGVVAGGWLAIFVWRYPHTLTFFNLFAGGPRAGVRFLADSNLDWGQHLKRLKKWMDREGVEHINLAYFGMGDPAYYGIRCTLLPGTRDFMAARVTKPVLPGYVAIGATVMSGAYLTPEWRLFYGGFSDLTPVAVLGNSLFIYRVEEWPAARPEPGGSRDEAEVMRHALLGDELIQLGWPEAAIAHYREYLRLRPGSAAGLAALGEALYKTGRTMEALEEYRQAVREDSRSFLIRNRFVTLLIEGGQVPSAVTEARQLIALHPHHAQAHDQFGVALASGGKLAEAEAAFLQARDLDPDDAVIRHHLTQVRQARQSGAAAPWRSHRR